MQQLTTMDEGRLWSVMSFSQGRNSLYFNEWDPPLLKESVDTRKPISNNQGLFSIRSISWVDISRYSVVHSSSSGGCSLLVSDPHRFEKKVSLIPRDRAAAAHPSLFLALAFAFAVACFLTSRVLILKSNSIAWVRFGTMPVLSQHVLLGAGSEKRGLKSVKAPGSRSANQDCILRIRIWASARVDSCNQ